MTHHNDYPTPEEIMASEVKHKAGAIKILRMWKHVWKSKQASATVDEKLTMFDALLEALAEEYNKPVQLQYHPDAYSCYYVPAVKTVYINSSFSIISTLHEFAHHLYGPSEKQACRWSVWLFKKVFPKAFAKLTWKGHLLVKPS